MKKIFTFLLLLLAGNWLYAQITITAADYFPASGDVLKTAIDVAPDGVEITQAGGPFSWDFSQLAVSLEVETVFRPASEGTAAAAFPNAEFFTENNTGGETYYNVNGNTYEILGFNGPDPAGIGLMTLIKFTTPIPERHAPLTFPATYSSSSSVLLPFSTDALPGAIVDSLNIPFLPDSIRLRITTSRNDFVDAYGKLTIPGGTYDVLREKRTEYRETRVDALVPFFGWQDVTDLIIAGGSFQGLGKDTVNTYNFYSNESKEAIAVVTTDDSGTNPQQVRFKNNGVLDDVVDPQSHNLRIIVSPNPFVNEVKFELKNFTADNYNLQVFNQEGKLVLNKTLRDSEVVDFSELPCGQYFYRLSDEKKPVIASGKLMKINP